MADCALLARCLRQTPGVEAVVSNGWPKDAKVLEGVRAIVLHTQKGGNVLFGGLHRRQVEELLKKGVGLTAIHWSTGADKHVGKLWLEALGGWFDHPAQSRYLVRKSTLRQADAKHPISRGWKDYELREEFYIKLRFMDGVRPVMKATIDGEEHTIGWIYERPGSKGRSFGFVGGHFHANFGEKPFRQALVNGILWTAGVEVPKGGAPCAITPRDMELPPLARKKK
jgi:type 1 glutamine amidotransferase